MSFHKFDKKSRFAVDCFKNEVSHFVDINISPLGLTIYQKNNDTGQYVMRCAIWYHLYNLKNVKNAHERVLL